MINIKKMGILYVHRNGNFVRRSGGEIVPCNIVQTNNEGKKCLVAYSPLMKGSGDSYWGFKWISHKDTVKLADMEYEDMLSKFL